MVIELIEQIVVIDSVEGFIKINEHFTRKQLLIHVCLYIANNVQYCVLGWMPLTKAMFWGLQKFMFLHVEVVYIVSSSLLNTGIILAILSFDR